jgi:hypothetical protein
MTFELSFVEDPPVFYTISEYVTTIFFGLDIIFNFNKVYIDKKKKLITSRKMIAKKYLKSWFILDFISFFPFFLFSNNSSKLGLTMGLKTLKFLKLLNVVRLIRLIKIFKKLQKYQSEDPIYHIKKNFKKNYEQLAVHCLLILISCHLIACFFYLIPILISPTNNWVYARGLQNISHFEKYLFSMHWIIETIITVGYGEIPIK